MKFKHLLMVIALLFCLGGVAVFTYLTTAAKEQDDYLKCPNGAELQNSVSWWNPIPGVVGPSATFQADIKGNNAQGRLTFAISNNNKMPLFVRLDPDPVAVVCNVNHASLVMSVAACRYKVAESYPAYSSTDVFPYQGCNAMTTSNGYFNLMMLIRDQECSSQGSSIICKPVIARQ